MGGPRLAPSTQPRRGNHDKRMGWGSPALRPTLYHLISGVHGSLLETTGPCGWAAVVQAVVFFLLPPPNSVIAARDARPLGQNCGLLGRCTWPSLAGWSPRPASAVGAALRRPPAMASFYCRQFQFSSMGLGPVLNVVLRSAQQH